MNDTPLEPHRTHSFLDAGYAYQEEEYSCGPTTIQNLQVFLGFPKTSIAELIVLCSTSTRNGTQHTGIIEALKSLEICIGEEKTDATFEDIERTLDSGSVCIVNFFNIFNKVGHFSLIVRHDEKAFYFIDSSLGFLRLKKKAFQDHWHNQDKTLHGWFVAIPIEQSK